MSVFVCVDKGDFGFFLKDSGKLEKMVLCTKLKYEKNAFFGCFVFFCLFKVILRREIC